jgi:hypothetical protein
VYSRPGMISTVSTSICWFDYQNQVFQTCLLKYHWFVIIKVSLKIDNRGMVTVRILRMFGRMSVLEHVTIRGGLIMTIQDRVCTDDPSSRVKRWEDSCFFRSTRVKMVGLSVSWDWVLKEGARGTTRALGCVVNSPHIPKTVLPQSNFFSLQKNSSSIVGKITLMCYTMRAAMK